GAGNGLVDAQRQREALHERRLARAHVAYEQEEVAAAHVVGDDARQFLGGGRRLGAQGSSHDSVTPASASANLARTKSARISASGWAPPRNAAAGCSVGMSTPWANGYERPRSLVMPVVVSSSHWAAKRPSVITTAGRMMSSCACRYGRHASSSS